MFNLITRLDNKILTSQFCSLVCSGSMLSDLVLSFEGNASNERISYMFIGVVVSC